MPRTLHRGRTAVVTAQVVIVIPVHVEPLHLSKISRLYAIYQSSILACVPEHFDYVVEGGRVSTMIGCAVLCYGRDMIFRSGAPSFQAGPKANVNALCSTNLAATLML